MVELAPLASTLSVDTRAARVDRRLFDPGDSSSLRLFFLFFEVAVVSELSLVGGILVA